MTIKRRLEALEAAVGPVAATEQPGPPLTAELLLAAHQAAREAAEAEPNDERAESYFRAIDSLLRHIASATRRATT